MLGIVEKPKRYVEVKTKKNASDLDGYRNMPNK